MHPAYGEACRWEKRKMNTAFYTAVSGMRTFQSALDITANNMANVNTTAYKAERGAFQDLLYTQMDVKSGELLTGHGVKMSDVQPVFIQGAFEKADSRWTLPLQETAFSPWKKETEEPSRCIPGMAPSKYPYRRRGTSWLPGTDILCWTETESASS